VQLRPAAEGERRGDPRLPRAPACPPPAPPAGPAPTRPTPGGPQIRGGEKGVANQAVWADADSWYERQLQEQEIKKMLAAGPGDGGEVPDPMAALEAAKEAEEGAPGGTGGD